MRRPSEQGDSAFDDGRAIIEVIFLGVLMLIPVVYILIALMRVQAATLAVSQAARDAGRAIDAAPSIADGLQRAHSIAVIDLADQKVAPDGITIRFVAPGADCGGPEVTPTLNPGDVYDVCVQVVLTIPGVPSALSGSKNTSTGVYTLHVGETREG